MNQKNINYHPIAGLKEEIGELLSSGYDGWFTIEHFGAPSMLDYTTQFVENIKTAYK